MRLPGLAWGAGQEEVTSQLAHEGREGVKTLEKREEDSRAQKQHLQSMGGKKKKKKKHSRFKRAK